MNKDKEIAEEVQIEREKLDETMRQLMREKEELARAVESAVREKDSAERSATHDRERESIETAQQEEARARLQSHADHLNVLAEERLQQIDALQKENLLLQARRAVGGVGGDGSLAAELQTLREDLARSRAEEEARRTEVERLLQENATLKTCLGEARSSVLNADGFHSQLAANEDDMHALSRQLQQSEEELRTTKLSLDQSTADITALRTSLEAASQGTSATDSELFALRSENESLQRDLAAATKELVEGREIMLALVGPCDQQETAIQEETHTQDNL